MSFRYVFISIRNRYVLWKTNLHYTVRFEFKNKIPRLVICDRYENIIKWASRIIAAISFIISLIALPFPFNLLIPIAFLVVERIFETVIFTFQTLYVQPFPNKWEPDELSALIFQSDPKDYITGILFRSKAYAKELFKCIRSWNYNNDDDKNNNICLSFVIENNSSYSMYLYNLRSNLINVVIILLFLYNTL